MAARLWVWMVLGFGLVACTDPVPVVAPLEREARMTLVTEDMDGQSVELSVGQVVRIELESIPTAGYIWTITDQPDFLELLDEGARPTQPDVQNQPGFTGGNHFLSFDLKAVAPGSATLHLVEARPWESDEPPIGTFSVTLTVTPAN